MVLKPIKSVKTIKDLIFWYYADLIGRSANMENYGFVVSRYKKLQTGDIKISSLDRDTYVEWDKGKKCIYCGSEKFLSRDHIIPQSRIGPNHLMMPIIDRSENCVWACRSCNSTKKDKDIFEWYGKENLDKIPKLALSKFLKVAYEMHEAQGTLDMEGLHMNGTVDINDVGTVLTDLISKINKN